MKLTKKGEAGQVLILALILLALGPLLVLPMLRLSDSSQRYNQVTEIYTLNAYAADSGIEYAKYQIYNNPAEIITSSLQENLVIDGIDVYVTAEYDLYAAAYNITSTATKAQKSLTIECTIVIDVGLFGNVVACNGNLDIFDCTFESTEENDADIYTNGDIYIHGNSDIYGDAKSSKTVTVDWPAQVHGKCIEWADVLEFPAINAQIHEDKAKLGGTFTGTYTSGGELGPLYIDGNLTIGLTDIILTGTVYVTGDVHISQSNITGFGDILAEGDFHMDHYSLNIDNPDFLPIFVSVYASISLNNDKHSGEEGTQAILYAPNETIDLDTVSVQGSVAAQLVMLTNADIIYPAEMRGRADLPGAGLDTVTYLFE